jgi:hypothetical protein
VGAETAAGVGCCGPSGAQYFGMLLAPESGNFGDPEFSGAFGSMR